MRATPRLVSLRGQFQNSRRASPPFFIFESPPGAKHGICLLVWLLPNYMASRIVLPAGALGRMEKTLSICRLCPVSSLPREFHITRDRKSATGMKSRGLNCFRRPNSIVFNLEKIFGAMLSFREL